MRCVRLFLLFLVMGSLPPHFCSCQGINFETVKLPEDESWKLISRMTQDPQGFLWLATSNGLYKYDGSQFTAYFNDPSNPNSLASNFLTSVITDKEGFLWIGTSLGLDRFDPHTGIFTHFRHNAKDPASISSDVITSILKDSHGIFWIGTMEGLNQFDPQTGKFKRYLNNVNDNSSLSDNQVRVIYEDREGILWIGTGSAFPEDMGTGVGGLNRFDSKSGNFIIYLHNPRDTESLVDSRVSAIYEDSHGTFWVGTAGDGLHTMDKAKGTFHHYPYDASHPDKLSRPPVVNTDWANDHIIFITEDTRGNIWIGTFLNGINMYDPARQKIKHYGSGEKGTQKIPNNQFWTLYTTSEGILWIGSWGFE